MAENGRTSCGQTTRKCRKTRGQMDENGRKTRGQHVDTQGFYSMDERAYEEELMSLEQIVDELSKIYIYIYVYMWLLWIYIYIYTYKYTYVYIFGYVDIIMDVYSYG